MVEELIDSPGRVGCGVKTSLRNRHDNRWRKNDDSVVIHFYQIAIVFREGPETEPPP